MENRLDFFCLDTTHTHIRTVICTPIVANVDKANGRVVSLKANISECVSKFPILMIKWIFKVTRCDSFLCLMGRMTLFSVVSKINRSSKCLLIRSCYTSSMFRHKEHDHSVSAGYNPYKLINYSSFASELRVRNPVVSAGGC